MIFRRTFASIAACAFGLLSLIGTAQASAGNPFYAQDIRKQIPDVVGIEFLFAEPYKGPIYTRFGHSLLRLVNPKIPVEKNTVLSFIADSPKEDGFLARYTKGLFGKYPVTLEVISFEQASIDYNEGTNQDIDRYILSLSRGELTRFLNQIADWLDDRSKMGDYTFLSNNCAGMLSRLFKSAGIEVESTRVPSHVSKNLNESGLSPFPPIRMASTTLSWLPIANAMGIPLRELARLKNLTDEQLQAVLIHARPIALAKLYYHDHNLDDDTQTRIRKLMTPYFSELNSQDMADMRSAPEVLYRAPESPADFDAINSARRRFFGAAALKSDLEFLSAMSREQNLNAGELLQIRRVESDPGFASFELARGLRDVRSGFHPRIVRSEEGKLFLRYTIPTPESVVSQRVARFVPIPGELQNDGESANSFIRFGKFVCPLAESSDGLADACKLLSTRNEQGISVQVVTLSAGPAPLK